MLNTKGKVTFTDPPVGFGMQVQHVRQLLGLTRVKLATRLGLDPRALARAERGSASIHHRTRLLLETFLREALGGWGI